MNNSLDRLEKIKVPQHNLIVAKPQVEEDIVEIEVDNKSDTLFDAEELNETMQFWEGKLATELADLNSKMPNYLEAEELYKDAKAQVDAIQARVEKNKGMIQKLLNFRNRAKPIKQIKLLRTTSHADKAPKLKREYDWAKMAVVGLGKVDKFITADQLWDIILQENKEELLTLVSDVKELKLTRYRVIRSFEKSSVKTYKYRIDKDVTIGSYENKIGLRSWMDEKGVPLAVYMKEFMFDKS